MSEFEGEKAVLEDDNDDKYRWPHRNRRATDNHRHGVDKQGSRRHKEPSEPGEYLKHGDDAESLCIEGDRYFFGHGVSQSYEKACGKYAQSAKMGYPPAMNRLGACFQYGRGVDTAEEVGLYWYKKAARLKDADSLNALGCIMEAGTWKNIPQDFVKAGEYYQRAVDQGHLDAQTNLGYLYEKGLGVPQDLKAAAYWYRKAAEKGFAKAQNNLGSLYYKGSGVHTDNDKAVEWYRKASAQGNATAMNNLGICYEDGVGVAKNLEQAARLYKHAGQKGNIHAHNNLGYVQMVQENHIEAAKSFRAAAEQGSEDGMYNLAGLYENGLGVQKDLHMALNHYEQAGLRGHTKAAVAAQKLARILKGVSAFSSRPNGVPPPLHPSTSATAADEDLDTPITTARKAAATAASYGFEAANEDLDTLITEHAQHRKGAAAAASYGQPHIEEIEDLRARCRELEQQVVAEQGRTAQAQQSLEEARAAASTADARAADAENARRLLEQEVSRLRAQKPSTSAASKPVPNSKPPAHPPPISIPAAPASTASSVGGYSSPTPEITEAARVSRAVPTDEGPPDLSDVVLPNSVKKILPGRARAKTSASSARKSIIGIGWAKAAQGLNSKSALSRQQTEKDLIKTQSRELSQAGNTLRAVLENEQAQSALASTLAEVVQVLWVRVMSLEEQLRDNGLAPNLPPGIAISQINGIAISELVHSKGINELAPGLFEVSAAAPVPALEEDQYHSGSESGAPPH